MALAPQGSSTTEERLQLLENFVSKLGFDAQGMKKRPFPVRTQTIGLGGLTKAYCVETIDPCMTVPF